MLLLSWSVKRSSRMNYHHCTTWSDEIYSSTKCLTKAVHWICYNKKSIFYLYLVPQRSSVRSRSNPVVIPRSAWEAGLTGKFFNCAYICPINKAKSASEYTRRLHESSSLFKTATFSRYSAARLKAQTLFRAEYHYSLCYPLLNT